MNTNTLVFATVACFQMLQSMALVCAGGTIVSVVFQDLVIPVSVIAVPHVTHQHHRLSGKKRGQIRLKGQHCI